MSIEIICRPCVKNGDIVKFDYWRDYALHICAFHKEDTRYKWALNNLLIPTIRILDKEEYEEYKDKGRITKEELDKLVLDLQNKQQVNDDDIISEDEIE